jgi:hypothetical protein
LLLLPGSHDEYADLGQAVARLREFLDRVLR